MKLQKISLLLMVLGIPGLFFNAPIAWGWIIGQGVMILLVQARLVFYGKVLSTTKFNMGQYVSYVLFTIVLISGPLLISFIFREQLEPLAIFGAYFVNRILGFVINLFSKEEVNHAS